MFPGSEFSLTCREFRDFHSGRLANCDAIPSAFAIDVQDGRFTLRKDGSATGKAIFTRREAQVLGQPNSVRFDLAGHEERIESSTDPVFYDPERKVLISVKEQLLVW
jgi:hypothetical protein